MFDLRARLFAEKDDGYREFTVKLIPGCENFIGVRVPVLRSISKEILKGDWRSDLDEIGTDYLEEVVVRGFVISYAKMDFEERKGYIEKHVPLITNWSSCDLFCYRPSEKDTETYFEFAKKYLDLPGEFEKRFGIVAMMKFIDDKHIDEILSLMDSVGHEGYYVKMAVAWTLSMCYVKYPEKTETYLKSCKLDDFTYNKTLQKITESLRVDSETKTKIRKMKRRLSK